MRLYCYFWLLAHSLSPAQRHSRCSYAVYAGSWDGFAKTCAIVILLTGNGFNCSILMSTFAAIPGEKILEVNYRCRITSLYSTFTYLQSRLYTCIS